jgi:uncharacterized protein
MKKVFFSILLFAASLTSIAQKSSELTADSKPATSAMHKIVFQLTSDDTLVHKAFMKQLNNVFKIAPESIIEVVCHGPGLSLLIQSKTIVQSKIQEIKKNKIDFVACEFSMSEKKITKEMMIPEAGYVPYGILEIVGKQEQGYSYIRSGF